MVNINHGIALSTVIVADNQSSREAKATAITSKDMREDIDVI
jgi:hypothetical protein